MKEGFTKLPMAELRGKKYFMSTTKQAAPIWLWMPTIQTLCMLPFGNFEEPLGHSVQAERNRLYSNRPMVAKHGIKFTMVFHKGN